MQLLHSGERTDVQTPKFKVGQFVRIVRKKNTFEKYYSTNFTEEIFVITEVRLTSPITYRIKGLDGEKIGGAFYEEELQKTDQKIFRVDKILKRRKRKGQEELFVKWTGYGKNTWIPWNRESARKNNPLLPKNIRGLIIGKSNSGKTTVLMNTLLQENWMYYNKLIIYGKSLHQPEYRLLKKGFEEGLSKIQISNIFHNQDILKEAKLSPFEVIEKYKGPRRHDIKEEFFDDCNDVPDPKDLDENAKNTIVLDDSQDGSQSKASAYYTRGRQWNCDVLFLAQNYFRLERQSVRENANFIILFPQDCKNLQHIWGDHYAQDMSLKEFVSFYKTVWQSGSHDFVIIDLTSRADHGKYRKNFDSFYIIDS